ncbi:hypothetical protein ABIF93_006474 [Bradyrhizobium japonicum]
MFKSQQHRARATASSELVKDSASAEEGRKFNTWRAGFVFLTEHRRNNEIGRDKLTLTKDTPGRCEIERNRSVTMGERGRLGPRRTADVSKRGKQEDS